MGMQNRSSFEEEWSNSFEEAEVKPPGGVWDKVELSLANSANGSFKRRLVFFKVLAAASVAFALTVGGVAVYKLYLPSAGSSLQGEIAQSNDVQAESATVGATSKAQEDAIRETRQEDGNATARSFIDPGAGNQNQPLANTSQKNADNPTKTLANDALKNMEGPTGASTGLKNSMASVEYNEAFDTTVGLATPAVDPNKNRVASEVGTSVLAGDGTPHREGLQSSATQEEMLPKKLDRLMAQLDSMSIEDRELQMVPWYAYTNTKAQKEKSKLWAGIDVGAGSFDAQGTGGSSTTTSFGLLDESFSPADDVAQASTSGEGNGTTFNFGINVGTQVSSRWVIQSGLVFSDWNTSSTSNVIEESGRSYRAINSLEELKSQSNFTVTQEYEISNSYRLISVPVQAGYLVMDRKLFITVLGGISNDLLLSKTIEDESGTFGTQEVDDGLRTYNLSGLLGTEFGYTIGDHYSISVMPQLRRSINSFNTSGPEMQPTFFEFGFRLKYIVK